MQALAISNRLLSEAIWQRIFEASAIRLLEKKEAFFKVMADLENLRVSADYNTGSISSASAWALYAATSYFKPRTVLEVGTFIGRSTLSMAMGMDDASAEAGEIHSCDLSNDLKIPELTKTKIIQYPKQSSTDMFKAILTDPSRAATFEMAHIDGRLQGDDFKLLEQLRADPMIVALDDFEGIEKGVANYIKMKETGLLNSNQLVSPPSETLLRQFGFFDHSTTALLIPQTMFQFTPQ